MSFSPRRTLPFRVALAALAALTLLPAAPAAADTWVRVAKNGLAELTPGAPHRGVATAIAADSTSVYVSSHHATSNGLIQPWVFRYRGGRWSNATPNWGPAAKVKGMAFFRGALLVATQSGGIWALTRDNLGERWRRAVTVSGTIRAMAVIGGSVCVVHEILKVSCSPDPLVYAFRELAAHPHANDGTIGAAQLAGHGGELYLGFGGASAGGRRCEVWRLASGTSWHPVSTTCFGDATQTWVPAMQSFGSALYIGTGGHSAARLARWAGGTLADASPYGVYDYQSTGGRVPIRFQSMAATSTQLFVGTRTNIYGEGDVIARDAAGTWRRSGGFGPANDEISGLAVQGASVFAATINPVEGFQVWQRTG